MGCGCNGGGVMGLQGGGGGVAGGLPSTAVGTNMPHIQAGGRSRRRKHTRRHRRSGTRKAGSRGRKRACKCPGGCKRSTCPCCTGKRFCCTKRCRGRGCRC